VLQAVPQVQQVVATTPQFAGQLGGWGALGDAAGDQHQLAGTALGALEGRAGPGVEDATTGAAVVEHGGAVGAVDGQPAAAAGRAGQAVGVQGVHEEVVTGLLVQQVEEGEVHGGTSERTEGIQLFYPPVADQKGLTTDVGP